MKKLFYCSLFVIFIGGNVFAQNVAINASGSNPDPSAVLDVSSAPANDKGFLIPRVALTVTTSPLPVATPATSLMVFNTATVSDVFPGFYYWNGTKWVRFLDVSGSTGSAWDLNGNAGTTVGSNFMGTTDNVSVAFKTNSLERMRMLNTGQVAVNSTTTFATSTFFSQATANNNAVDGNAAGTGNAVYGQNTGTGSGVMGLSNNATGTGVVADNTSTTGTGLVAAGNNSTLNSLTVGSAGAFTGTGIGLVSYATTVASGNGIIAAGNNVGATSMTAGSGGTFISNNIGAAGIAPLNTGNGIYGQNTAVAGTGTGNGVVGLTNQSNGSGVWGQNSNAGGSAMTAFNTAVAGTGLGLGLLARTSQSTGTGVTASNLNTNGTGIAGAGNNIGPVAPAVGAGGAFIGWTQGLFVKYNSNGVGQGIHIEDNFGGAWNVGAWNGVTNKIIGTGGVATVVKDLEGNNVTLYCPESPEILFQDYGQSKLIKGKVHIEIDPIFAKNIIINEKHPLRVYVQLEGNCKGVYVANKTTTGFDVVELDGGQSNTPFQYTIVCNRADEKMLKGRISHFSDARWLPSKISTQKTKKLYTGKDKQEPATMKKVQKKIVNKKPNSILNNH